MAAALDIDQTSLATWSRLSESLSAWFDENRPRLENDYPFEIDPESLLSFELGLYLHQTMTDVQPYDQTPTPGWIFARTGVDGEHFSLLTSSASAGVVVLTAPMAFDAPNMVVGQNLEEFLALACSVGVTGLTEVCYRGGLATAPPVEPRPTTLHDHLLTALALDPPADPTARLKELQATYGDLLPTNP